MKLPIEVIVAIIFAAAALVPVLVTTIYNPIFNKPHVDVQLIPNFENNASKALINLTNDGVVSASNISLAVKAPSIIKEVGYSFGTAKVILNNNEIEIGKAQPINNNALRITIPKLVHGVGSIVQLSLTTDTKPNIKHDNYTVFVSYDEGSSVWNKKDNATLPWWITLPWWMSFMIIYGIGYGTLIPFYYFYWGKRSKGRKYMSPILGNLLALRRHLEDKPSSDLRIMNIEDDIDIALKRAIVRDFSDFLILKDLYYLIDKREEYINKIQGKTEDIEEMNCKLLKSVTETIKSIDWKKYYVSIKKVYHTQQYTALR